ncbi:4051_t:CDS:2, partial [Funneliformis caledonium]
YSSKQKSKMDCLFSFLTTSVVILDAITSISVMGKLSYFNLRRLIEVALTLDEGVWCGMEVFKGTNAFTRGFWENL